MKKIIFARLVHVKFNIQFILINMIKMVIIVYYNYKIVIIVFIINILIKNKTLMPQSAILKNLHVHQHNSMENNSNL